MTGCHTSSLGSTEFGENRSYGDIMDVGRWQRRVGIECCFENLEASSA